MYVRACARVFQRHLHMQLSSFSISCHGGPRRHLDVDSSQARGDDWEVYNCLLIRADLSTEMKVFVNIISAGWVPDLRSENNFKFWKVWLVQ